MGVIHSVNSDFGPLEYSPSGFSVHAILQSRILKWVPYPSPGDFPNPVIEPRSPALKVDSLPLELPETFTFTHFPLAKEKI